MISWVLISLAAAIFLLLVLVNFKRQSFEDAVGEEIEVDEDDRKDEAAHFVEALRGEVRILHAVAQENGHPTYDMGTYCSRLKTMVTLSTWLMRQK